MTPLLARLQAGWAGRGRNLALVLAAGLFVAAPFLTRRGLGTNEAYNYSLAVADFVTQARVGEFPVFVGQSEYAWNGRIHPLRTAPYLLYAAGLLDLATLHQLGFWTLQNLVVGLSLFGGVLSFYLCLRSALPELEDGTAGWLAAAYGLSPGLLSTAYAMDLYMTVMTAPWIPLALGGLIRADREGGASGFLQSAIGLAAAWLAHPPVAFWLTAATGFAGAVIIARSPKRGRALLAAAGALALFAVLAGYAFVSALTVQDYGSITHVKDLDLLLSETRRVFAASLQPVSARADQLGDFQLGYAYWAALLAAAGLAAWRRHHLACALVTAAVFFLLLTLPVPGVQTWLWNALPTITVALTNQWPMQRFYLLVTALGLFAFALVRRRPAQPAGRFWRETASLAFAAAVLWTCWQALRFVARGFDTRLDAVQSARMHRPENVDLTVISFAILGTPAWFVNGVMDPAMEFRLRAPFDARVTQDNAGAPVSENAVTGTFRAAGTAPDRLVLSPRLTLEPGRRHRLTFDFSGQREPALLQLRGRTFFRQYELPVAGGPEGFGAAPGHRHSLSLWTTAVEPEEIELSLVAPGIESRRWLRFADFRFEVVNPDQLPVALESLVPLRARVRAREPSYLEAPRMHLPGYVATVDGRPAHVQASPDGLVLAPVPAGESRVEVRYVGPQRLRAAFWLTFAGWCGVAGWLVLPGRGRTGVRRAGAGAGRILWRFKWRLMIVAVVVIAAVLTVRTWRHRRNAVGPIVMQVVFPRDFWEGSQPLLVTGRPNAGTFVFARYLDPRHIVLGVDVWGLHARLTDPIETDYFATHTIEISEGALFPSDHPAVRTLSEPARHELQRRLRVVFDGRTVIDDVTQQYPSRLSDVTVGVNRIGGSLAGIRFTGEVLDVRRGAVRP